MRAVSARNHVEVVCRLRAYNTGLTVVRCTRAPPGELLSSSFAPLNQKNVFVRKQLFLSSLRIVCRVLVANVFSSELLLFLLTSRDEFHESCLRPKHVSRSRRQSRATSASPKNLRNRRNFFGDSCLLLKTSGVLWRPPEKLGALLRTA